MKKYNLSKPEKYIKDGAEKTYWANVGTMTEWEKQDGTVSRIIEIPAIGLKASVFEQKPREEYAPKPKVVKTPAQMTEPPEDNITSAGTPVPDFHQVDDINPDEIPF